MPPLMVPHWALSPISVFPHKLSTWPPCGAVLAGAKHDVLRLIASIQMIVICILFTAADIYKSLHQWTCAINYLKVLFRINQSVATLLYMNFVLRTKICCFSDWLEFYQNLGWAPEHAGQWGCFVTAFGQRGTCSVSSALWFKCTG